jgi:hypothetical protein
MNSTPAINPTGIFHQPVAFDHIQVGQRHGTAHRVAGIGETMHEGPGLGRGGRQNLPDPGRDDGCRHREIGAGQPLGERDDIGADPIGATPEPLAGAAKAGDDFVNNQQNVVPGQHSL